MQHPGGPRSFTLRLDTARLAKSCIQGLQGSRRPTARQLRKFVSGNGSILVASASNILLSSDCLHRRAYLPSLHTCELRTRWHEMLLPAVS